MRRSAEYQKAVSDLFRTLHEAIKAYAAEARWWDKYALRTALLDSTSALEMARRCRETRNHFIGRIRQYRRDYLQEAA